MDQASRENVDVSYAASRFGVIVMIADHDPRDIVRRLVRWAERKDPVRAIQALDRGAGFKT